MGSKFFSWKLIPVIFTSINRPNFIIILSGFHWRWGSPSKRLILPPNIDHRSCPVVNKNCVLLCGSKCVLTRIRILIILMGLVRITSWYPNFNGSHFGLPPSEIHRMTGLPPKIVWTMTYSHKPHCLNLLLHLRLSLQVLLGILTNQFQSVLVLETSKIGRKLPLVPYTLRNERVSPESATKVQIPYTLAEESCRHRKDRTEFIKRLMYYCIAGNFCQEFNFAAFVKAIFWLN